MDFKQFKRRNTKANVLIDKHIDEIKELYDNGMSISKIGIKLNIDRRAIARLFKNNKIVTRSGFSYATKYTLNENYFDVIDTEEKAYILGFIYADGNNFTKTNCISIKLSLVDVEILEKFKIFLNTNVPLYYSQKIGKHGQTLKYVTLSINNKHMSQKLNSLGIIDCKSKKVTFPNWLSENLYSHFIRGLIDGDGCIYLPKNKEPPCVILTGTRNINDFISDYVNDNFNIKGFISKCCKQDINVICDYRCKGIKKCKQLLDWLYLDSKINLERKYNKYLAFLTRYFKVTNE